MKDRWIDHLFGLTTNWSQLISVVNNEAPVWIRYDEVHVGSINIPILIRLNACDEYRLIPVICGILGFIYFQVNRMLISWRRTGCNYQHPSITVVPLREMALLHIANDILTYLGITGVVIVLVSTFIAYYFIAAVNVSHILFTLQSF